MSPEQAVRRAQAAGLSRTRSAARLSGQKEQSRTPIFVQDSFNMLQILRYFFIDLVYHESTY
jgi:hypothetical protein